MPPFVQEAMARLSALLSAEFCFLIVILLSFAVFGYVIGRQGARLRIRRERKDAVRRSRSVIQGQVSEQIAPFLPGFPCNAADVRFVGKPVDFVAFCGLSQNGVVDEIAFIEVKTASSRLSEREKSIRRAVEQKRVRYVEYRPH